MYVYIVSFSVKSYCFLGAALRTHDFLSTVPQAVVRKVINNMKQNTIISNKRQNKLPTSIVTISWEMEALLNFV